jgi:hypothetical protein
MRKKKEPVKPRAGRTARARMGGAQGCQFRRCACGCRNCYVTTHLDGAVRHCCRHRRGCHMMCRS